MKTREKEPEAKLKGIRENCPECGQRMNYWIAMDRRTLSCAECGIKKEFNLYKNEPFEIKNNSIKDNSITSEEKE